MGLRAPQKRNCHPGEVKDRSDDESHYLLVERVDERMKLFAKVGSGEHMCLIDTCVGCCGFS
jgi:hypothetical protein